MEKFIREWDVLYNQYNKEKDKEVNYEKLREAILSFRDRLLIHYGIHQELITFLKPSKREMVYFEEKLENELTPISPPPNTASAVPIMTQSVDKKVDKYTPNINMIKPTNNMIVTLFTFSPPQHTANLLPTYITYILANQFHLFH